ncbi:hypothetical protein AB6813_05850 [bacterium RCC_150]
MDFWIPLLGGALGAALINGILALHKLRRDRLNEHEQWLRNEKIETYSQYLEIIRLGDLTLEHAIVGAVSLDQVLASKDHIGGHRLRLISPKAVREATKHHIEKRAEVVDFLEHRSFETWQSPAFKAANEALYQSRMNLAEVMAEDLRIT